MNPNKIGNTSKIPRKNIGQKIISFFTPKNSGETTTGDSYLLSEHLSEDEIEAHKGTIEKWDKIDITISNELGNLIEEKVKDSDYRFGVHRSYFVDSDDPKNDNTLQNIMQNGLDVFGDASSGAVRKDADPSKTVSFCNSLLNAVILTKSSRQGSNGAVLVAIPSEFVSEDGEIIPGEEENVYNYGEGGFPSIKPEYILGFAPGGGHHGAHITFIPKSEILKNSE